VALTAELCSKVDAGELPSFDADTYGAAEVKQALRTAQHDKCCFCESKLGHSQFGDIEHFRPKKHARQSRTAQPTTGYYWLAYAWNNLYLSCEVCNRRHKWEIFPLANPEQRVSSHHRSADVDAEQPMFIDPGSEDPTGFIEFRREFAAPVAGNARGSATVEALQLNRPGLVEYRRERRQDLLAWMIILVETIRRGPSDHIRASVTRVLNTIIAKVADCGEYASMTRSVLRRVAPWREHWAPPVAALLEELQADTAGLQLFHLDEI
jgi:uncharacterized protein (TIGR02646 family)